MTCQCDPPLRGDQFQKGSKESEAGKKQSLGLYTFLSTFCPGCGWCCSLILQISALRVLSKIGLLLMSQPLILYQYLQRRLSSDLVNMVGAGTGTLAKSDLGRTDMKIRH